jgi:hypothetical protein
VAAKRTELVWSYEPVDLFEAEHRTTSGTYELRIKDGQAVATLLAPQNPVNDRLARVIAEDLEAIFLVRQLQSRRSYSLNGPTIHQHGPGGGTTIQVQSGDSATTEARADVLIRDQAGNVLADSKNERIAADAQMLDAIAPKVARSRLLRGILNSCSKAVTDSANELVHLYEVRDALATHYGGEQNARAALGISGAEWKRLGALANAEPLEQGRHRGEHVGGLRRATATELEEARGIVRKWITALAAVVT